MIIIISKIPFCVKARAAGSRSPLPIMMIWNQFRRGTGYLTEFRVILYNRNKYKCAQKGLFSCCASAVHLKSLHLMTDDFGMMTYWKVMKVMMHILRMSKQQSGLSWDTKPRTNKSLGNAAHYSRCGRCVLHYWPGLPRIVHHLILFIIIMIIIIKIMVLGAAHVSPENWSL